MVGSTCVGYIRDQGEPQHGLLVFVALASRGWLFIAAKTRHSKRQYLLVPLHNGTENFTTFTGLGHFEGGLAPAKNCHHV